jgi:uncharacterized protein (TIGR00266 family)
MEYKITGTNLQFVNIEIQPNEMIYAEAGAMVFMSGNMGFRAKARGGVMKGLKRMFTGESFFMSEFWAHGGKGFVAFAGNAPGKIKALDLRGGKQYMLQKDAFLVAENSVGMDMAFQKKLGAGFFGGEGFILQKVWGEGTVFIHACGDFVEMKLKPGEIIKVDTGSVVGWEASVQFDIQRSGDLKTSLFGGEGIFLTQLTGPGKIILQSMTLLNLANALTPFMAGHGSSGSTGVNLFGQ